MSTEIDPAARQGARRVAAALCAPAAAARRVAAALCVLLALCALLAPAAIAANEEELAGQAARLARENELLKRRLELADSKDFYLILHPETRTLSVMLAGVTLSEYAVRRMQLSLPRRVPLESDAAADWADRVWMKGVLDPERVRDRVEIVATGDSTTMPEIPIPPLPEEALQAPARFRIRYGDGVSIEIRNVSGAGTLAEKPSFWQALWAPIRRALAERAAARHESVRLVLQLEDEDAAALYRSLPPDTHFMVLYE